MHVACLASLRRCDWGQMRRASHQSPRQAEHGWRDVLFVSDRSLHQFGRVHRVSPLRRVSRVSRGRPSQPFHYVSMRSQVRRVSHVLQMIARSGSQQRPVHRLPPRRRVGGVRRVRRRLSLTGSLQRPSRNLRMRGQVLSRRRSGRCMWTQALSQQPHCEVPRQQLPAIGQSMGATQWK